MRYELFPQDDISKKTPLNPPVIRPLRVYAQKLMAEWLVRLKDTAF
jgi:hypothetical protein